jgi:hypothetical protein
MKKIFGTFIVVLVLLLAGTGLAQNTWGFNQGDNEFTLLGSGTSDNDLDDTTLSAEVSLGHFLTDAFEIGLRQGISYADIEGGSDQWDASTRGFLDYHFDLDRFQPFVGANFGYLYGDNVNETFIAGPEAGLKFFLVESTFLYVLAEYNFTFDDADEADDAFDDGRFVYALGMGFKW